MLSLLAKLSLSGTSNEITMEMIITSEAGSYLRLIDFCITQLKAQEEEKKKDHHLGGIGRDEYDFAVRRQYTFRVEVFRSRVAAHLQG